MKTPKEIRDLNGNLVGYLLIVNQPNRAVLEVLDHLHDMGCRATLYRLDIAVDFITQTRCEAEWLKHWLAKHVLLRWRPKGRMLTHEEGIYWVNQKDRRQNNKKRSARDLLVYASRLSKITGTPCTHLELRFQTSAGCRTVASRVKDVLKIDPSKVFGRHLRLSFVSKAFVDKAVRDAVKDDRRRHRGREIPAIIDRRRAAIPRIVKSVLHRGGHDRATLIKDRHPKRVKKTHPITLLNVPTHFTFAPTPVSISTVTPSFSNSQMISMTPSERDRTHNAV